MVVQATMSRQRQHGWRIWDLEQRGVQYGVHVQDMLSTVYQIGRMRH
jgi:hypothetical protein